MLETKLTKSLLHTTDTYITALEKAGVLTIKDLLNHFPREYEDRTNVLDNFSLINIKEKNTILVKLLSLENIRTGNNKILSKAVIEDKNGFLSETVWFNRKFLATQLKPFIGKKVIVSGKVKYAFGKLSFQSPEVETDLTKVSGEIVSIYSDLNYIPSKWIVGKIFLLKDFIKDIKEVLPKTIIDKYNFISRKEAFYKVHFPRNKDDIEVSKYRLAYEELFAVNYKAISKKHEGFKNTKGKGAAVKLNPDLIKNIFTKLPFTLTNQQKITLFQILKDMEKDHSMSRLLEGDVGTGKTIVALIAIIHSIIETEKNGNKIQVAIMAPTEILARQHFKSMSDLLFTFKISNELLVGSTTAKRKKEIKARLKTGNIDVIIGTHALVQEDVIFDNLGFVVIDEQHRFGVKQREVLEKYVSLQSIEEKVYEFISEVSDDDFSQIEKIMKENEFNKKGIDKNDYVLLKDSEKIIGFGRIWKLEDSKYELSNLWIKEEYRGKKLGYKLANFLYLNKYESKNNDLFIAHNKYLKDYYINLGFREVEIYPERFNSTIEWSKEVNKAYIIMKLKDISKIEKIDKNINVKQITPHNLNMTATPIPRTLALTLYGDQDLSIISEYPKGRKEIFTKVAKNEKERGQIELFVRNQIESGKQVFWISPLVEESEKIDLANAISTYESLVNIFSPFAVGLLHGRMKAKEKEQIMKDFSENKIQILSSTSVVEVGVDIPNATIMCIEGAERFGLSQLHQFRGRVGRGNSQSYCYLFPSSGNYTDRLKAMERTNNGFELAEIDLEIRGPGEVYGLRQSGVPDLKIASLTDLELISQIREDIEELFSDKEIK